MDAETSITSTIGSFVETFSPAKQQQSSSGLTKLEIISIVRLAFSLAASTVWKEIIPLLGLFDGSTHFGWGQDMVDSIVQGGLRLTGNFFNGGPGE
jgi:hypothetical protein